MTVKDIVCKIADNYYPIVIEVFDPETHLIKTRHKIKPHNTSDLVNTIQNESLMKMEVEMIVPFLDNLSICVKEKKGWCI